MRTFTLATRCDMPLSRRPALVLPMVLLVLVILGVLAASFAFHTNARVSANRAVRSRLQTRLAAEAGLEKVKLLLAVGRMDVNAWYHNPEELHRVIVYMPNGDETVWGTRDEHDDEKLIYRFSIVADDPTDDLDYIRLGITDESSKLDLNRATREQLEYLVELAAGDRADEMEYTVSEIVDAILDWRDEDSDPQREEGDTEDVFYLNLPKPYKVKNAPFDTVEELLLVKGIDGRLLYGEDQDRNGLLSANEDDGDTTFPDDNGDGFLNRGLYPYLTVYAVDRNISNDNRRRIYLYGDQGSVKKQLMEEFAEDEEKVNFILAAVSRPSNPGGRPGGGPGGGRFGPPGGGPGGQRFSPPGSAAGGATDDNGRPPGSGRSGEGEPRRGDGRGGNRGGNPGGNPEGGGGDDKGNSGKDDFDDEDFGDEDWEDEEDEEVNAGLHSKVMLAKAVAAEPASLVRGGPRFQVPPDGEEEEEEEDEDAEDEGSGGGRGGRGGSIQPPRDGSGSDRNGGGAGAGQRSPGAGGSVGPGSGPGSGAARPITTPAQLLMPRSDGTPSPLTLEDLPRLMDRLTTEEGPEVRGLININTATERVLRCLPELADDEVAAILARRAELDSTTKATTAWLVTEDILPLEKYIQIAPKICARGTQFMVESLGYADHIGMVTRLQVIFDMRGPLAQTIYYRDITSLGGSFPIREGQQENLRVP